MFGCRLGAALSSSDLCYVHELSIYCSQPGIESKFLVMVAYGQLVPVGAVEPVGDLGHKAETMTSDPLRWQI